MAIELVLRDNLTGKDVVVTPLLGDDPLASIVEAHGSAQAALDALALTFRRLTNGQIIGDVYNGKVQEAEGLKVIRQAQFDTEWAEA